MASRMLHSDELGPFIRTGGYAFRPPSVAQREFFGKDPVYALAAAEAIDLAHNRESQLEAGCRVDARHVAGTTTALVGDEVWVSSSIDPRYVEYTATREETAHGQSRKLR